MNLSLSPAKQKSLAGIKLRSKNYLASGRCGACGSTLDTISRCLCRLCLDKNRDRKRRTRGVKKPMLCHDCWEYGHREGYCQR